MHMRLSSQTSCSCFVHSPCALYSSGMRLESRQSIRFLPRIVQTSFVDSRTGSMFKLVPCAYSRVLIAEYGQIDWWSSWRKVSCLLLEYDEADASADSEKSGQEMVRSALGNSALWDFGMKFFSSDWPSIESRLHEKASRTAAFPPLKLNLELEK